MFRLTRCAYFALLLLGLAPCAAYAANDGSEDPTSSTGDTSLTLTIPNLIKISGVGDLSIGTYDPVADATKDVNVCVYTNDSSGNYKVTVSGNGTGGAFTVADGQGHTIVYSVKWNNQANTTGNTSLTANVPSGTFSGANTSSQSCGGGANANVQVVLAKNAILSKPAGAYSGTLQIVIQSP